MARNRGPGAGPGGGDQIYDRDVTMAVVCQEMAEGNSLRKICKSRRDNNIPWPTEATIRLWAMTDEWASHYARARDALMDFWADEIVEISDDTSRDTVTKVSKSGQEYEAADHEWINRSRLRVDARKWIMSKLAPKRYGDRLDVTSGGEKVQPAVIMLPPEEGGE